MEANIEENPEQNKSEHSAENKEKSNEPESEEFNPSNVIDSRLMKSGEYQLHVQPFFPNFIKFPKNINK